jgi:hypothetical protein
MRVVSNAALIQKRRSQAQMIFFASFGVIGLFLLLTTRLANLQYLSLTVIQCILFPALFSVILFAARLSNNWIREPLAWEAFQSALRGISTDAVLYHFVLPARHVLISPQGVFVLYPMLQDRTILVEDDYWALPGGLIGTFMAFMRQEQLGNPPKAAQREAQRLQKWLDANMPGHMVQVRPVIVMTSPRAKVDIKGEQTVPVTFSDPKLSPNLKDYIKTVKDETTLTPEQIEALDNEFIYEA